LAALFAKSASETGRTVQNLAASDFMRTPTLAGIDLSRYKGHAGEFIKVVAEEGAVGTAEVTVVIKDRADVLVEQGLALMENDGVSWWYSAQRDVPADQPLAITITARDQPGHPVARSLRHTTG
jgi:hypothetical protein